MKNFFEDLWELEKTSWDFTKKHWKGLLVFYAVVFSVGFVIGFFEELTKDHLESLKRLKLNKEEDWG